MIGGVAWCGIWLLLLPLLIPSIGSGYWREHEAAILATLPLWAFWLCYYPCHLAILLRADALRRVYASGHGLRWRDGAAWHQAGWNEVRSVSLVPREHQQSLFYWSYDQLAADREVLVECVAQRLRFHPKDQHADRLQRALDRLLAARRAGRAMPGLAAVPDTALSRADRLETAAERGVSRRDPDPPGPLG